MMAYKLISLNLWRGGLLLDAILPFLERERPDILLLQEVLHCDDPAAPARFHSIETLQKHLDFLPHVHFAPALIDNEDGHRFSSGNAVASRFAITGSTVIPYGKPFDEHAERTEHNPEAFAATPRNLQHVVLDANGTELNIFNTQGVWDLDGDNPSERRRAMCRTVAAATAGKQHVMFAGDINLKPSNAALAPIDAQLQSVFGNELSTTFNVRRKDLVQFPGYATAVVDLMYISHDMHALEHSCPDADISDHLPLIAILEAV